MPCAGCGPKLRHSWGWKRIDRGAEERLEQVMRSWRGTPYRVGERVRGAGTDCWQLGAAILDAMARNDEPTALRWTAHDAGTNHPAEAVAAVRELMAKFAMEDVTKKRWLEPGDFLAIGSAASGVGSHLLIQSPRQGVALHAPRLGSRAMLSAIGGDPIRRVYRVIDRSVWQ